MNCTAEKQLSHGVFESFEIRKDSFFTVPQCEDTAPIQIGEILNNTYLITRFIAQGGMGIVYEGIDLVLHRKVAIKVLVTDFDDEEYEKELKLFQTEINLCGNLRHPNVIQIYYSGIHHRLPYLVMEYIEGIPINEYVMKQRRFNWNQKVKLISQVASGLAYIHKNNILHRDIKPSNILVKADGTPVLIDFGISIKKNLATVATSEGELSGTIHYMSPEQVAGEYDKINERSDIYSLGLILYELLIKRPAYTGSPNEIIGQIFNSSLLPPSDVNINISETLSNITMKAIAKEPEDRYSTATEFIEDLRLYLKNVNNKPIINKVPLWQKAFCYLKPNTAIAISLIWIAFLFIIIPIIIKSPNGTGSLNHASLSGISGPGSEHGQENRKQSSSTEIYKNNNTGQDNIAKFRKANLPHTNTIEAKNNGNILTGSQNTYKELAYYNPKQLGKNLETNYQQDSTESPKNTPEQSKDTPTSNITLNPGIGNNQQRSESGSKNPGDRFENPGPTPNPKPRVSELTGITLEVLDSFGIMPMPYNWNTIACIGIENIDCGNMWGCESISNKYLLSNNVWYKFTPNGNESTLEEAKELLSINCTHKPYWENKSIIISPGWEDNIGSYLDRIELNNASNSMGNLRYSCCSQNIYFDDIDFNSGQCFLMENNHYYLPYNDTRNSDNSYSLYQLKLDEEYNTIIPNLLSIKDPPIKNTSIVVLKNTLYYFTYDDNSNYVLCAVKVSFSQEESQVPQVESQKLLNGITVTNPYSLLVTDNTNRIWIINENGVIRYNTKTQKSEQIDYECPCMDTPAVSFYSKKEDALYLIVNNQSYMQKFSTREKILAKKFIPNGRTLSEGQYEIVQDLIKKNDFVFVNDSLQIKLDKDNINNKVSSFVKVGDEKLRENWKREFLPVENDLDTIGIIFKDYFRNYYKKIKDAGYNPINNADSCSVLISKEYYSLKDWKKIYKDLVFNITYKGQEISIPCLPFCCIGKLESNKEVKVISQWLEAYKSNLTQQEIKQYNFNQQEIEQFNYLDEKGYGITERCRLVYIIPNE